MYICIYTLYIRIESYRDRFQCAHLTTQDSRRCCEYFLHRSTGGTLLERTWMAKKKRGLKFLLDELRFLLFELDLSRLRRRTAMLSGKTPCFTFRRPHFLKCLVILSASLHDIARHFDALNITECGWKAACWILLVQMVMGSKLIAELRYLHAFGIVRPHVRFASAQSHSRSSHIHPFNFRRGHRGTSAFEWFWSFDTSVDQLLPLMRLYRRQHHLISPNLPLI